MTGTQFRKSATVPTKALKVLITEAELKQALAITQSLGRMGVEVYALSANPAAQCFYSRYCRGRFLSPYLSDKNPYVDFLEKTVRANAFDLLIPCSDAATEYVSEFRERLSPFVRFLVPEHADLMRSLSKAALMRLCAQKGIPAPVTMVPQDRREVLDFNGTLSYPVVVKASRGASAENVRYARRHDELVRAYDELSGRAPEILVQEHVRGSSVNYYGLCDQGEVRAFFMLRTLRSYPVAGGTPSKAVSIYDQGLEKLCQTIVRELRWTGMVNLDFMQEEGGGYKLLEVNPRFAGTTALAIASGVDLPRLFVRKFLLGEKITQPQYRAGQVFRSLFREEVLYALERPGAVPRMLAELLDPRVAYGVDVSDLKPFIGIAKTLKWDLAKKRGQAAADMSKINKL